VGCQDTFFISRDFTWHLKNGKSSKLSRYRLKDNYVRFYLKYIQPNKNKIEKGVFKKTSVTTLPAWESTKTHPGCQIDLLIQTKICSETWKYTNKNTNSFMGL